MKQAWALSYIFIAASCVAHNGDLNMQGYAQYIIETDTTDSSAELQREVEDAGGTVLYTYTTVTIGFAAELPIDMVEVLDHDARVRSLSEDTFVYPMGTQVDPPAHLDELDDPLVGQDMLYSWTSDGTGIPIYVMDTGLRGTHTDFAGRVNSGFSYYSGGTGDPCGHGTFVSGLALGATHGVAKGATVVPIRVLTCAGASTASIVAGIDWILTYGASPGVVNMSFGVSSITPTLANAVDALIDADFVVVAPVDCSVGCGQSFASIPGVIGVAQGGLCAECMASSCIDIFARGHDMQSAWHTSDSAVAIQSGSSFAAPLVSGAAARYLQKGVPPGDVLSAILPSAIPLCGEFAPGQLYTPPTL